MKYWLLTSEFPPFYGGGISTYCYHTATMFADRRHQVTVFVYDSQTARTQVSNGHVRVVRFNANLTGTTSCLGHITNISYAFSQIVKEYIDQEGKPDIIEAQEYLGIAYYLLQFKSLLYDWCSQIPVIITMHSPSELYMEYNHVSHFRYPNYWICEMERFCLRSANHVISPSYYITEKLSNKGVHIASGISVIANPYSVPTPLQQQSDESATDQIIFFGKLTAQKGVFQLLKYFKTMWDEGFTRSLYLIGGQDIVYHPEGITMGSLIRKRYATYINNELLIPEKGIRPSEIQQRLLRAELVIIPSMNDNLPYAVIEMMALGKIVLVSKQGGQFEIVEDGVDGFIFDHNEIDSFRNKLVHILSLSNCHRKEISERAKRKIENNYSHQCIYGKKETIIKKLLGENTSYGRDFPCFPVVADEKANNVRKVNGKLSVVIPYYNMGKFLQETVDSVKASDYKDMEIIIVNDGSDDAYSIEQLDKYRNRPGITVIDIINNGVATARNVGAEAATGSYLAFIDADDTVAPGFYTKAIKILNCYTNVDFVGCWTQYFGATSAKWPAFTPKPPLILFHNVINSSSLVYKKNSFLQSGLNDPNMAFQGMEDYNSVISLVSKGHNGVVLPEFLFHYRVRRDSMYRTISAAKKLLLQQYIIEKHRDIYAQYATDLLNLSAANGPGILLDNPSLDLDLADKLPFGKGFSLRVIKVIKSNRYVRSIVYKIYSLFKYRT